MRAAVLALLLAFAPAGAGAADAPPVPDAGFAFEGPFGQFDRAALRRGLEVYRNFCAACHGLRYVAWRNLAGLGYGEEEIKAMAAETLVRDGPDDTGEMFDRPGLPSDRLPDPFPNARAAAYANSGVAPPDLSLMTKARVGGADYVYALLTGYGEPPEGAEPGAGGWNRYFPGGAIAMPQPLWGEDLEYADGTPATLEQEARDVTAFLAWAADPLAEERKKTGLKVILFLLVLAGLFTGSYWKVRRSVKG